MVWLTLQTRWQMWWQTRAGVCAALAALAAPVCAQDRPADPPQARRGCAFDVAAIPADTIVVAAGKYGGRETGFQIDQSGHTATQFDVQVHADKPVALLLGAYEPSIWSIKWTEGTRIVAVYATGYHRQVVAGLPKDTPVITSDHDSGARCGYHYVSGEKGIGWINPVARSTFGRPATRVYVEAPGGKIDILESSRPRRPYVASPETPPESFRDRAAPLAGPAGLEDAVAKGLLRPLTQNDIETVRRHYLSLQSGVAADVPPVAGKPANAAPVPGMPDLTTWRAYMVLKPFVFPAGLYGAHLATFVVPKGVAAPTGNPGHSMVVDLNKAVPCGGPMCRR